MGFINKSDGMWLLTMLKSVPSMSPSFPFLLLLPLPQHLSYIVSAERVVSVPTIGSISISDYFKVHNDAALVEVRISPVILRHLACDRMPSAASARSLVPSVIYTGN